ncbi:MAG: hypothetical protein WCS17_11370 [Prevotella sp.]|jgi:hypothetical protein|nr:hypothetical protein [Prevotella sp.]MCH4182311.1 hypothetical protein [Prevotella sp.]MCH4213079.1 hypothetical protein [Prevotella sp.]MCH4242207.1 hypothetical protein [Prevotella sp.]
MNNSDIAYKSLADIRLRKEMLKNDILKDDHRVQGLWNDLFHKPETFRKDDAPSKRLHGLLNMSAGAIDGIILGWKLYRKFKRK